MRVEKCHLLSSARSAEIYQKVSYILHLLWTIENNSVRSFIDNNHLLSHTVMFPDELFNSSTFIGYLLCAFTDSKKEYSTDIL